MNVKSTGKMVESSMDVDSAPPLTAEERQQLDVIGAMNDEDIDYSDIPRTPRSANWTRPGMFGGPAGSIRQAALREKILMLDEDVADFFKGLGDDSAERMNHVLRKYVETHRKTA